MWFPTIAFIWLLNISDVKGISSYYMDINCDKVISTERSGINAFQLSLTQSSYYSRGLSCQLVVKARPGHRLMFYFENFDIKFYSYVNFGVKHSGCIDYIAFKDGASLSQLNNLPYIRGFTSGICGISRGASDVYTSTEEYVTIYFRSSDEQRFGTTNEGFTLLFTEFHTGTCSSDEFRCPNNRRCIKNSVTCNDHNPCGDHTDCITSNKHSNTHSHGSTSNTEIGTPTVIGIAVSVGFTIILVIVVVAVVKSRNFYSRARRHRRRNRSNISFIDVSNVTPGQPPSYEEVCGGFDGPYAAMAPPPYAEEDPNKITESSADGDTQPNTSQTTETNTSNATETDASR